MPKKEKLVKHVRHDEDGRRHITWERKMVEENPVLLQEPPIGIITLLLVAKKQFIVVNGVKAKYRQKVYDGDIVSTGAKSRIEITLLPKGIGKIRIGEKQEGEMKRQEVDKKPPANFNDSDLWHAIRGAFQPKKDVSIRTPTAVAAIRG